MTEESILDKIVAIKREGLPWRKQKEPMESLERRIRQLSEQQEGRAEQWSLKRAIFEGPRGRWTVASVSRSSLRSRRRRPPRDA